MYLKLYGYPTDAIICNRLLPTPPPGGYWSEWQASQLQYRAQAQQAFSPLPMLDAPFFDREVVGSAMLERLAQALFADRDPADVLYVGPRQQIVKTDHGYTLLLPLPFVTSSDVQLTRSSSDELIVRVGNHKQMLSLPHTLASMEVLGAQHVDGALRVHFGHTAGLDTL